MARPQKQIWAEERSDGELVIVDGPSGVVGRTVKVENTGAHRQVTEPDPNQGVFTDVVDDEFDIEEETAPEEFTEFGYEAETTERTHGDDPF